MKALVTGHKGFIGSYVFNELKYGLGYGECVEGLDSPDDIGDFKPPSGGMFAEHYDVIIHLAAFAALRDSIENPEKFWENNVEKSKPIFDYCRENNVRLLYASSAGAHGWSQNPYAITKKVNELQAPPNSVGMRFLMYGQRREVDLTCYTGCFRRILLSISLGTIETISMLGMWQRPYAYSWTLISEDTLMWDMEKQSLSWT